MKITTLIPANPWRFILLASTFAFLSLIVLTQANPGTELPSRDSGFFMYIGKQIVKGQMLYRDVWDHKPPAIYYLNAFALRLGRGLRWGIWLVEFVFLFAAITASFSLLKKLWGFAPALFGVFVWLWGLDFTLEGGNFTEEYPLVFHFLALLLLLELTRRPEHRFFNWTLGLLLSMSFLFRPNNILVEVLVILVLLTSLLFQKNLRAFWASAFWIALGVLIPIGVTSAYFAWHGLFNAMFEASILYNLTYGGTALTTASPLQVGFGFLNLAAWIGLTGYLLLFAKYKDIFKSPQRLLFILLMIGAPLAVALSDPARRNYAHYFMNWLPFIALLSAFAFHVVIEKLFKPKEAQPSSLPLLTALGMALVVFIATGRAAAYVKAFDRLLTSSERDLRSPIAIYVDNHTNPGEYVLFWATHPGENFMSRRDAPTSALFYPMMVDSEVSNRLDAVFFEDLQRNRPVLIVDMGRLTIPSLDPARREEQKSLGVYPANPPDNLDEVLKYIEENYYLEAVITGNTVYRLDGTSRP
ncbi:MAG: hypothetical protein IH589_14555 [Anaerolineales bacterium]|nr:hypothetical protein [Anaerolineales bacterium]